MTRKNTKHVQVAFSWIENLRNYRKHRFQGYSYVPKKFGKQEQGVKFGNHKITVTTLKSPLIKPGNNMTHSIYFVLPGIIKLCLPRFLKKFKLDSNFMFVEVLESTNVSGEN